ncbi:MAG TPA: efflux RND transporter periplasmic adaptor subunit [Candidatus Acidoferrales bacterium]|nr:efflux RND transporter periplasmic adaptor subunit [Candidatus Acidoferrales bacterium]
MSTTTGFPVQRCAVAVLIACSLGACAPRQEYGGTVHTEAVYVGSITGGRVQQVFVEPADRVVAGQLLVRLDDRVQQAQRKVAQARLDAAQEQLDEAALDPRYLPPARIAVEGAQAALDSANAALDELSIRSPTSGVVESIDLQPGDILLPGDTAVVVDTLKDPYVTIYVPQQDLAPFAVGQSLVVRSDALPGESFVGVVEERDPSAQFTPRNVQTADDRATLTFGVKIRIKDAGNRLYAGTTVTVLPP